MNSHTRIKILLRRPHLNRDPKPLQHLPNPLPQNMQPDNPLLRPLANNLHLRGILLLLVRGEHVEEHGRELGCVGLDVFGAVLGDCFRFGEACCAYFWVGEDDGGDVVVGEFGGLEFGGFAEEAVSQLAAGGDGDYRMLVSNFVEENRNKEGYLV